MANDDTIIQAPKAKPHQVRARLLFVMNLLFCLMMLEVVDIAASERNSALLWLAGALLLVSLISLVWLLKKARIGDRDRTHAASSVSLAHARWVLLMLLLVASALRFYQLGTESFWYDEVWTADWAGRSLGELWQITNPLPYLVAHFVLRIGASEFVLRFAAALVGILTVPAVYMLGQTLYGRRVGLVAAVLLGTSVYAIFHSQELRFYSWQMLLSSLSLYFLLQALRHNRWQDWLSFGLTTVLNVYNHPFAWFVLASEALYTVSVLAWELVLSPKVRDGVDWYTRLQRLGRRLVWPASIALATVALYGPQWRTFLWFYHPTWIGKLSTSASLPPLSSDYDWLTNPVVYWLHGLFGDFTNMRPYVPVFYLLLGLFLLGLVSSRGRTVLLVLLWTLLPLPVLVYIGISIYPRYMSYMAPLILIVMAKAITYLAEAFTSQPKRQTAALVVLTCLVAAPNLLLLPGYYSEPQKDQWRELAAVVDDGHQAGDVILFNSKYLLEPLPFDWYSTTPAEELIRQPFPEGYMLRYAVQLDDLDSLTAGYERVWLAFCEVEPEIQALIRERLKARFELAGEWPFKGLDLFLYTGGPPGDGP
jgi:4-amino-4-deoxy-L-arabinose transferase-like glycosyltransferase